MDAHGDHGGREMMRAARHIRDDFGLLGIWDARFEHTNDRRVAITFNAAEVNRLANYGRISIERVGPKTIRENDNALSLGTVVFRPYESPKHGTQAHHLEIRPVDHTAIQFARFAEANHGKRNGGKVAKLAEALDPLLQVSNFRHRPRAVFGAYTQRALPDVNQPIFIAIDQRLDEHAANKRENGGVGSNTQRQRDDYDKREPR